MPIHRMPRAAVPLGVLGLTLAGCQSLQTSDSFLGVVTPYRIEVVQGNVVTSEQVALIKPGQTRAQVRDILGSPLLTDPFHADRWDYVFTLKRQGFDDQQRSFVVLFDKDKVRKIDAPELPSENEFVAQISRKKLPTSTPKLELTDAEKAALPVPVVAAAPAASAVEVTGATRSYPPLETAAP